MHLWPRFGHNKINGCKVMYFNMCDGRRTDGRRMRFGSLVVSPPPSVGETTTHCKVCENSFYQVSSLANQWERCRSENSSQEMMVKLRLDNKCLETTTQMGMKVKEKRGSQGRVQPTNTLLKPKRHSLRCHGFMGHALLLHMCTNVVYFRVMRRLCRRKWNWLSWTCIHDNGHMITACDVWL